MSACMKNYLMLVLGLAWFRLPSFRRLLATVMKEACSTCIYFFADIEKGIDGNKVEALAETLSLIGKLFEIYFVRLIGTPNQQFKKSVSASVEIAIVVQNH